MALLDTTLLIDFLRGKEEAIEVILSAESLSLATTEINVFELVTGAYLGKREVKEHLERMFAMLSRLTVLPLDRKASLRAGEIAGTLAKEGKMVEEMDGLIAGIALANGITEIITANKSHFERIKGLKVITY